MIRLGPWALRQGILWSEALLLLLFLLTGCGHYQTLVKDWESSQPPPLFTQPANIPAVAPVDTTATEKRKPSWQSTGKPPEKAHENQALFFAPDPKRLKQLQPTAADDAATIKALADGFSLDDFLILTQLRSPALREAEAAYQAMRERYEQAGALSDLLDRYSAFTQGLEPGIGPMTGRPPLAMQYPFPGATALRGEIAHQDVLAASERRAATRRSVLTAARQAFYELLYAHKAYELAQQSSIMLGSLKDSLAARYEVGQADIPLLVRINQDYSQATEQVAIQLAMQQARNEPIRALLSLPQAAAIGRPAETFPEAGVPALDSLLPLSLESRQELRELRSMIRRAELLIELAETGLYPGFSLNLSLPERNEVMAAAGPQERPEAFGVSTKAARGAGQPLVQTYGVESAYLAEARQNLIALGEQLRAAEADTKRAVYEAWFTFDKAKREEAVSREKIVPLAQTELDTISAGYAAGSLSFADLVETTNRWFAAKLAWERFRADLGISRAELEAAVGTLLPKP